jgi:glycosyltransferase involved in cell wall biosynthesis
MRILSITAGAAGMYCGSCLRDNALAVELLARGHEVTLLPLYTPTNPDETNVSRDRVLFGGISIYLQHHSKLFRRTPRFLDRLWDAPWVIKALAGRSLSTDPRLLGDLTISMLEGERGVLRKEFDKLLDWIASEPLPDIVNLPNSLLIGLARPLRDAVGRPVCCTLQGEDLFLDGLIDPYRQRAIDLIRAQVPDVECFIPVSEYYAPIMSRLLQIPATKMSVVPLGINLAGHARRSEDRLPTATEDRQPAAGLRSDAAAAGHAGNRLFRVGYFARIAPEKGLHVLADAYIRLRARTATALMRLEAAGYLAPAQQPYLDEVRRTLNAAGIGHEFLYHGALDRDAKLAFLRSLDVLSVPAPYDEPKGVFVLEAMASGVPVVQPARGAFPEMIETTGGGLLVAPDDPDALAGGLHRLWADPAYARTLADRAFDGVRRHYSIARSADRLLDVYNAVIARATHSPVEKRRLASGR